ncbi:hypothetical protein [Roseivirga sp. E12]|uniref:hypothetical protein n=1 Tax=Roseivirga sp. E12 TaxID=2819237 RepID=UPI001ABCF637|nr:hypothetical protein [Roseivirga sp. E12]MBO3697813.1 hypothetical protein [Roseivirga sp. E12]
MRAKDTSYLIEIAKQAPTELAKQEVLGFIKTIPTLPPPSNNWFQNFNLNSIIMTTTAIALVTSAVIYFSSPSEDKVFEPIDPSTANPPSLVLDSLESPTLIMLSNIQTDTVKGEIVTTEETAQISIIEPTEEEGSQEQVVATIQQTTNVNRLNATLPKRRFDTPQPEAAMNKIELTGAELRSLKKKVTRYMKDDKLYESDAMFNTVEFKENAIIINGTTLRGEVYAKYAQLLQSFDIGPGPDRRVVTSNKFIQVGDFTSKGFNGSALGRDMEIYFLDSGQISINSLFDRSGDKLGGLNGLITPSKPKIEEMDSDIILKTEGRLKDSEVNISQIERIFGNDRKTERDNTSKAKSDHRKLFDSGKEAVSIYTKENEGKGIDLNGKGMRTLKKDLYRQLTQDNIISSKKAGIRMFLDQPRILVNGNPLSEQQTFRIERILDRYDIKTGVNVKILFNPDFIIAGEFIQDKFFGSVQGSLDSKKLRGSVFEQDFAKFPIFGFSDGMRLGNN